jgi:hypothetical protein
MRRRLFDVPSLQRPLTFLIKLQGAGREIGTYFHSQLTQRHGQAQRLFTTLYFEHYVLPAKVILLQGVECSRRGEWFSVVAYDAVAWLEFRFGRR